MSASQKSPPHSNDTSLPNGDRSGFAARGSKAEIETGENFAPKFDAAGLIPVVTTDAHSGEVLMLAYMNAQTLALTIETGIAHYWSRSRQQIWKKGETSGNLQQVRDMRTDCDQDAIWLSVDVAGAGATCHTGARSCFYRKVEIGSRSGPLVKLSFTTEGSRFTPDAGESD